MRTHQLLVVAAATLGAPAWTRADAGAGEPLRLERYHADGLFIDDPFALSSDGKRVAWVATDGASRSEVRLATVGSNTSPAAFPFDGITPERVEFVDGERVLVVDRSADTGFARARVFGPGGPDKMRFGPASGIALATVAGVPAIVTWTKLGAKGSTRHEFVAYRRDTLKPFARKTLVENGGRIAFGDAICKPLVLEDGYTTLVAQKEGAYDKARDIRNPDVEAQLDVFSGKPLEEREIKDVVAWAQLLPARQKHPNERRFPRFTDDLQQLELVEGDRIVPLTTPRPLHKYDPQTLAWQDHGADGMTLSLTIDPVNRDAVRAQKADQDWLDVYRVDVKTHALTPIARLDGGKRPTGWRLGGTRLAVLRKHKGFGRGGTDLEVWELAPTAARTGSAGAGEASGPKHTKVEATEHTAATKQAADRASAPPVPLPAPTAPTKK
jgi:hypothetical protein